MESKIFRHLLDEPKQDELQFDDFSPESVELFITLLKDRALGDIDRCQFRELNKLCVVFEVEVLQHGCKKWLEGKINCADNDEEKTFLFDECLYIFNKWKNRCDIVKTCYAEQPILFISIHGRFG